MEEEAHEEAQEEAPKDETKIQVEAGCHMVSSYLNLHLFHDLLLAPDVKQLLCVDESLAGETTILYVYCSARLFKTFTLLSCFSNFCVYSSVSGMLCLKTYFSLI